MASYKTQAIIINRLNLGESDRILTLFSPERGKVRAICKGSRKTKSKYGGHIELFSLTDFVVSEGKNLDIVSDANLVKNYLATSPDMDKIKTIYYFAEVVNKLLPDDTANHGIYKLFLYCLSNIQKYDYRLLQLIFIAKLLKILGIYPELNNCVKCEGKPDIDEIFFSKGAGGIIDKACSIHFEDSIQTEPAVVKLWRFVADSTLVDIERLKLDEDLISKTSSLANDYIHCVTMIDYKSLRVLS